MPGVLIVDDAAFMRLSLKNILESKGFTVLGQAEDGQDALIKIKELSPDIVTLDITMPNMDGLEAIKEIKNRYPGVKVVMISAMGQEAMVREAALNGAKGFIVKPFNEEAIEKTFKKLLTQT